MDQWNTEVKVTEVMMVYITMAIKVKVISIKMIYQVLKTLISSRTGRIYNTVINTTAITNHIPGVTAEMATDTVTGSNISLTVTWTMVGQEQKCTENGETSRDVFRFN